MRTQTLDDNTAASDPGRLRLSHAKVRRFHPELYEPNGLFRLLHLRIRSPWQWFWQTRLAEHLMHGDSRAALVVSADPLLVAAYTDELDCVALLHFPQELAAEYGLSACDRLLTVNLYARGAAPVPDLENGPASYGRYANFSPLIAEFASEDAARIAHRKGQIAEDEWMHTGKLAADYLAKHGHRSRDGRPLRSSIPAY